MLEENERSYLVPMKIEAFPSQMISYGWISTISTPPPGQAA